MYSMICKGGIFISIYNRMKAEHDRLTEQMDAIASAAAGLPEGRLICKRDGKKIRWYQSDGASATYISKRRRAFAEQLAAKKYLSLKAEEILHEKRSIEYYLRHHAAETGRAEALLVQPGYQELLRPYFSPISEELTEWMYASYEKNGSYPEQLIHRTSSGNMVRSKSEAIIDMLLHISRIPFRYECKLQLGETSLYPDFTIRHPMTGAYFYWEHFGMMDNSSYCRNVGSKLQLYCANGIVPSVNLITTYETKDIPLDAELVEELVRHYFL